MASEPFALPPPPVDLFSAPSAWQKELKPDGNVVFIHKPTGKRCHMMLDKQSGKYYYYDETTNKTSWELPQMDAHEDNGGQLDSSSDNELHHTKDVDENHSLSTQNHESSSSFHDENFPTTPLPKPWRKMLDEQSGKYYYYDETTNKTSWELPQNAHDHNGSQVINSKDSETQHCKDEEDDGIYSVITQNHELPSSNSDEIFSAAPLPHPIIKKQDWLKVVETGKKQKKYWTQQWIVLLANNLLFFKDQKQAVTTKNLPYGKPDSSCYLRGATVDWADDKSSKKKILKLRSVRGLHLLLQHENPSEIQEWLSMIKETIQKANHADPVDGDILSLNNEEDEVELKKSKDKKKRFKSTRHGSDSKGSDNVRSKLKKLMTRRPTFESLQERGIIKETIFGCSLDHLCNKEHTSVPNFVKLCVEEVEKRGLDIDGIYRVSGNLSHVQKLRYLIDRDQPVDLSDPQWEDIHLITGALKMFLRELPEPVFPFQLFDEFINACKLLDENEKIDKMRQLVQSMPSTNKDTLIYLMQHFCKVVEHSPNNRMEVQNVAIVFGPTLLLKPPDKFRLDMSCDGQMAVFMAYQNQIIDLMLTKYHSVFGN